MSESTYGEGVIGVLQPPAIEADHTNIIGYEIGNYCEAKFVPLDKITILTQTRTEYEEAGLNDLWRSISSVREITPDGRILHSGLVHSPHIAVLDREQAERYVFDLNKMFDTDHSLDEVRFNEDGLCYIVIAGHRRIVSSIRGAERDYGLSSPVGKIECTLYRGINWEHAFLLQLRENVYKAPKPQDEAVAIAKYATYLVLYKNKADGDDKEKKVVTNSEIARNLGCSSTKVGDALRYIELGPEIHKAVNDELNPLKFTHALWLAPLIDAYKKLYTRKIKDDKEYKLPDVPKLELYGKEVYANLESHILAIAQAQAYTEYMRIIQRRIERSIETKGQIKQPVAGIKKSIEALVISLIQQNQHYGLLVDIGAFGDEDPTTSRRTAVLSLSEIALQGLAVALDAAEDPEKVLMRGQSEQLLIRFS